MPKDIGGEKRMLYKLTTQELTELMKLRGSFAVHHIQEHYPDGVTGLCTMLNTSLDGIKGDQEDVALRQKLYGKNVIPPKPMKPFLLLMYEALQDMTLIVLIVAAAISMGLSLYEPPPSEEDSSFEEEDASEASWIEGFAILGAVAVVVFVTAINDWKKEKQFRGLKNKIEDSHKVTVLRGGRIQEINIVELVVGDICLIKYGDMLPADGIIVQSNDLAIDESSLTGESAQVHKGVNTDPMLYSGTHVMEGSGRMLITAVGLNSQSGIIMTLLGRADSKSKHDDKQSQQSSEFRGSGKDYVVTEKPSIVGSKEKSVLQAKLTRLAIRIGYIGTLVALLTVLILSIRLSVKKFLIEKKPWSNRYIQYYVQFFIIGITVLVVAVPEGLPLAVTIALAYSVRRMMKDSNLVRHLDACETMGNATTICSDKTGTLTTNRMTVVCSYICGEMRTLTPPTDLSEPLKELLANAICINSGYTSKIIPSLKKGELPVQVGNKTECALLGFIQSFGFDYEKIRQENPEAGLVKVYTFNSKRKCMTTVVALKEKNGFRVFTKGASEILLHRCRYVLGHGGKVVDMNQNVMEQMMIILSSVAKEGMRTLLVGYKDMVHSPTESNDEPIHGTPDWNNEDSVNINFTCLAILGIEDPVRPEVPESIRICQSAGITVRMVTGDNVDTARSIALKCGIIQSDNTYQLVLEADEFNRLIRRTPTSKNVDPELFDRVWPRLRVLARSSPKDKYVLVRGIIESNLNPNREVVAVTGDGTNDGPALKIADVGFAMGIAGTDVAKEASDIILMDDNFASIVKAVMWGRSVYDNISKFLQFQLTVNVVAVFVAFLGACFINETPLKAIQMLWVNLIMDTLASLALATELPTPELLKRKPYGRTQPLISTCMMKNIIGHSCYQLTIIFMIICYGAEWFDIDSSLDITADSAVKPEQHFTIVFNSFVLMTLFNELNSRKLYSHRNVFSGITKNYIFITIWISTMSLQLMIIQLGGQAFHVAPLDIDQWLWCFVFGVGSLLWGQIVMTIPDRKIPQSLSIIEVTQEEVNVIKNKDSLIEPQKSGRILWVRSVTRIQKQLQMEYVIRQIQNQGSMSLKEP